MSVEEVWRRRSDDELVEAAQRLEEYTDEGRKVIQAELLRRGISGLAQGRRSSRRQEVPARDNLAGLGKRLVGQCLDGIVAMVLFVVPAVLMAISDTLRSNNIGLILLFPLLYILFADGFQDGQSYGKRIVKTAVVDATTGKPCSFGQSFVRNLLLFILSVIDWVFIFGQRRQRLGDKAANTIVVSRQTPRRVP